MAHSTAAYSEALTVTLENDILTGSDNNYTNGVGITWVSNDLDSYDDDSSFANGADSGASCRSSETKAITTYASWTVAQEMHTPDDITIRIRPWTTNPMRAFCMWTACSMHGRSVGPMHGSSNWAWSDRHPRLNLCRSGSTT